MFRELTVAGHRAYLPEDVSSAVAILGEDLAVLGAWVKETVGTRLPAMTGMQVGNVDVHFDGVYQSETANSPGLAS